MTGHISKRAESGFTLIELMISMVIGLALLGAVTSLYLGSSQSTRFQSSVQRMEESGRFAIDLMSRNLRMARYDNPLNTFEVEQPLIHGTTSSSGAFFALQDLKANADTITVRFEGGAGIRDCLGAPVAEGSYVTNVYGVDTSDSLVCGTSPVNTTALVEGVEDMRLRYGIDLDSDGIANRFVSSANVGDWDQVVALQVAVLVNSVTAALTSDDTVCLGCTVFNGFEDRLVRAEYQTVIGVRN